MQQEQNILDDIEVQSRLYSCFPLEEYYTVRVLWRAGTFLVKRWSEIPIFYFYPMLGFISIEPDSGKTQSLDVTGRLSYNAISLGSYTPAVCLSKIDRAVTNEPGAIITIPFDDLDTKLGAGRDNSDLINLFNEGYRANSVVSRCSRFKDEDRDTPAFCPKCFSALSEAKLPPATMSRTIAINMRPWQEGDAKVQMDIDATTLAELIGEYRNGLIRMRQYKH